MNSRIEIRESLKGATNRLLHPNRLTGRGAASFIGGVNLDITLLSAYN